MSFMLFWKEKIDGKLYYENDNDHFSLAGNKNGLIHKLWIKRGKPVYQGWTVTANELLGIYAEECNYPEYNSDVYALIIDFHPTSTQRIGLIEIDRIHIFTYGEEDYVEWSPLMLELNEVYSKSGIKNFSSDLKKQLINRIEVKPDRNKFVEFLYLNGDDLNWNWGKNGSTNAVFLYKDAMNFFKTFL